MGVTTPTTGAAGVARLRVLTTSCSAKALRRGLAVRVTIPRAGSVRLVLRRGMRVVAAAKATAHAPGALIVRLPRLSAAKAGRLRGAKLTLAITSGAVTSRTTLRVR